MRFHKRDLLLSWHSILIFHANIVKDSGKRRRLQICHSPVYCCAIALVPGSEEEKVSAKAQAACYSQSEEKNRSVVLSEDLRGFKVRSKEEICLGFRAAAVLIRTHGSEPIWRGPLVWKFSSFKTNLSIHLWACRTSSCASRRKHASSNSGSEASRWCFVAPCNRQFLSNDWTYIWCREMHSIKT